MKFRSIFFLVVAFCSAREVDSPFDTARKLLFGSNKPCAGDSACATGICTFNMCAGYLLCPHLHAQNSVAGIIAAKASSDPELRRILIDELAIIVEAKGGDEFIKGRAAALLARITLSEGGETASNLLGHASEVVRFRTALQMCELGDEKGRNTLKEFQNHRSEAVRMLAEGCIRKGRL